MTENRRAQEELRIAAVAFESREGIMITDEKQVILRVNRAFTEITGYDEADVCGEELDMAVGMEIERGRIASRNDVSGSLEAQGHRIKRSGQELHLGRMPAGLPNAAA